ncbi:hypothetical protein [Rhodoferax mekongensis]|uniref:PD-(D/E)XK endonuclease-like domain-containing protein n=1 Tax=Rhodoferax mekongensis TaxID=3068341 RepID=A0ABZ0B299_9BURK|nr:hypothetical protein [Rhodoferax sp. TBRC 17307]WNO05978.1 hypothetical protein RAN89_06000 [Rhodoferax sp. TBRC 17307]
MNTAQDIIFDEEAHIYRLNGNIVPGVTSILKPLTDFSMVKTEVLESASKFGRAVHKACELDDLGELDEGSLDPALRPYLIAWRKFTADYQCEWEVVEQLVYHSALNYAGTPDRYGKVKGRAAVVDIKSVSGTMSPAVGPQLAAYKNAIPGVPPVCDRIGVQLKPDGTYVAKNYIDRNDWPVFCSLLTLRNWCSHHNITPTF